MSSWGPCYHCGRESTLRKRETYSSTRGLWVQQYCASCVIALRLYVIPPDAKCKCDRCDGLGTEAIALWCNKCRGRGLL